MTQPISNEAVEAATNETWNKHAPNRKPAWGRVIDEETCFHLMATAAESAVTKACAERDAEEVRRIKHLNRLGSWAQQDPTGPLNTEHAQNVRDWVLAELKAALGSKYEPTEWQPDYLKLRDACAERDEKLEIVTNHLEAMTHQRDAIAESLSSQDSGEKSVRCVHEWFEGRCVHCELTAKEFRSASRESPVASEPNTVPGQMALLLKIKEAAHEWSAGFPLDCPSYNMDRSAARDVYMLCEEYDAFRSAIDAARK